MTLLPQHQALLDASGITAEVAATRGYFSVDNTKAEIEHMGFGRVQCRPPALVIPQRNVLGENPHHQLRADDPRMSKGKPVKYETPTKAHPIVDVPPMVRAMVDDPTVPLIITEGSRKADSAVSRGMCAISINGVYGWRGNDGTGASKALADWEMIPLNGRRVLLAFDSDLRTNAQVSEALRRLRGFLNMRHAEVGIVLFPTDPSGRKVGLDDWLAADASRGFADLGALTQEDLPDLDPAPAVDGFDDIDDQPGWVVLDDVFEFVSRFVWFTSPGHAIAVALWIVHTYLLDSFEHTPRLHIRSPIKRSGKSRLLEVLDLLVAQPLRAANVTAPVIFRTIELRRPTILLDEVDRLFNYDRDDDQAGLIAVINAGFQPGTTVPRMVGQGADMMPREFPTYAAVALAGIGSIPDTIADRSIIIRLDRRPSNESVGRFKTRDVRPEAAAVKRRIAAWSARHASRLADARPLIPDGLNDRAEDMWEPLLAIADEAGAGWPDRARCVAVELCEIYEREDIDANLQLRLLHDIHDSWPAGADRYRSSEMLSALKQIEGAPWAEYRRGTAITARQLAAQLKGFDIVAEKIRFDTGSYQGYRIGPFRLAWERYDVIASTPTSSTSPADAEHLEHPEPPSSEATSTSYPVATVDASTPSSCWHVPDVLDVPDARRTSEETATRTPAETESPRRRPHWSIR